MISNKLHLAVQKKIADLLFDEEIVLEYRCKNHIADVFWKKHRLVFEVQCSPMTLKECKRRTKDLENQGMIVVWILHQKTFNKKFASPMELYLRRNKSAYFTNISQDGEGIIFDQEEAYLYGRRTIKSPPLVIDIKNISISFSKASFKGDVQSTHLLKRLSLFPSIWQEKRKILIQVLFRKWRYFWAYLQWKIKV